MVPSAATGLLPSDRRGPKPGARAGGALFAAAAAVRRGSGFTQGLRLLQGFWEFRIHGTCTEITTPHFGSGCTTLHFGSGSM